ncbi:hypothetical protein [Aurantiacibacter gangjinensis]|uniref:hypothetical protein n=1 Tax=Aurantiacibacter gangjinensis TaxID=502682 RepID=UPI0012E04B1C|nr:hypothetical protein [Aurantiacibacter gangjinensis]
MRKFRGQNTFSQEGEALQIKITGAYSISWIKISCKNNPKINKLGRAKASDSENHQAVDNFLGKRRNTYGWSRARSIKSNAAFGSASTIPNSVRAGASGERQCCSQTAQCRDGHAQLGGDFHLAEFGLGADGLDVGACGNGALAGIAFGIGNDIGQRACDLVEYFNFRVVV